MADTITVKSALPPTKDGGNPVALWEVDPAHPVTDAYPEGGECFVAGPKPVKVAETAAVLEAIRDGKLERVSGGSAAAKEVAEESTGARVEKSAKDGDK